jgi:D-alanyl-D-alanine dipeptidase
MSPSPSLRLKSAFMNSSPRRSLALLMGALLSLSAHSVAQAAPPSPAPLPSLSTAAQQQLQAATHIVTVSTASWNATTGKLSVFARDAAGWKRLHGPIDVNVGKKGLGWGRGITLPPDGASAPVKKEGDGKAPAGVFRLGQVMGYDATPPGGLKLPYRQITGQAHCVDDVGHKDYNRIVELAAAETGTWKSSEVMRRKDEQYRLIALVDHNALLEDSTPQKGSGSCIFLHVRRAAGSPTVGCTSMAREELTTVLSVLPAQGALLLQLPAKELAEAGKAWGLPTSAE